MLSDKKPKQDQSKGSSLNKICVAKQKVVQTLLLAMDGMDLEMVGGVSKVLRLRHYRHRPLYEYFLTVIMQ